MDMKNTANTPSKIEDLEFAEDAIFGARYIVRLSVERGERSAAHPATAR